MLMAVQLREVNLPKLQRAALCWRFMSFAFNSIYCYFLFLYHLLLKSIFYFNALGSVMDFFITHPSPFFASCTRKGSYYANTTEKSLEASWVSLCPFLYLSEMSLYSSESRPRMQPCTSRCHSEFSGGSLTQAGAAPPWPL